MNRDCWARRREAPRRTSSGWCAPGAVPTGWTKRERPRRHQQRYIQTWVDEDGMLVIRGIRSHPARRGWRRLAFGSARTRPRRTGSASDSTCTTRSTCCEIAQRPSPQARAFPLKDRSRCSRGTRRPNGCRRPRCSSHEYSGGPDKRVVASGPPPVGGPGGSAEQRCSQTLPNAAW
jgi:hypothetical protein